LHQITIYIEQKETEKNKQSKAKTKLRTDSFRFFCSIYSIHHELNVSQI